MKVFVAGATGALGIQLLPMLAERGHDVTGTTHRPEKADRIRALGAKPAVADALDPEAVARAVAEAEPDVIVHQLTALSGTFDLRRLDRTFVQTNRLRTEGTDILLSAGQAAGAKRIVAQSFAGWLPARIGGPVKSEDDPLDTDPPANARETVAAIRHVEHAVTSADWAEGIALRYGAFYGPGTSLGTGPEDQLVEMVRKRKLPIIGDGGGKAPALARPIHGRDRAVRTFGAWMRAAERIGGIAFRRTTLNGQPAAIGLDAEGRVINTITLDIADGQIQAVQSVVNPDKLQHLGPVANIRDLLASS